MLIAGFSPVPYKLFTISAGAMSIAFFPFMLASLVGRGLRFFLVAWLLKLGGPNARQHLRHMVDTIGYAVVGLLVVAYASYHLWPSQSLP